jgi:hypothetical protein
MDKKFVSVGKGGGLLGILQKGHPKTRDNAVLPIEKS